MRTYNKNNWRRDFSICLLLALSLGCIRDIDELEPATFSTNPAVFLDGFSAGLNYAAFGGSVPTAFNVDTEVTFTTTSQASMRFEVPDANDPRGAYAGGTFFTDVPRDLSEYDALTFWAKASKAATIDIVGFGNDLGESKYQVALNGMAVNTNWQKYYIPIPDPAKLSAERGMFYYSEGPEEGRGYTFWIDDLKFEKLGTISQARPMIVSGANLEEFSFIGNTRRIDRLQTVFNLPTGVDVTVDIASSYLVFNSSDESVATVDPTGNISVIGGPGNARITATLGSVVSNGSITIQSIGQFPFPAEPTQASSEVISIFSDNYDNVPVDFYNGFWEFSTTLSSDFEIENNNFLSYFNFNFVGIQFTSPTINANNMTHLHIDIFVPNLLSANGNIKLELVNAGSSGPGVFTLNIPASQSQQWISFDIPISSFAGLSGRANLSTIVFSNASGNISRFFADNIYFYKAEAPPAVLTAPAPTPNRNSSGVISVFSDAYDDVQVDTWRTDWSSAVLEDISIQGNAIKKYSALDFVGIETVNNPINIESMTHVHIDVWSADFTSFGLKLVDFGPGGTTEHQVNFTGLQTGTWVGLDIPIANFTNLTSRKNISQFILVGQPTGATTVHFDNLYFYDQNAVPILNTPAPTPTRNASDVISVFSDSYSNLTVDTWRTDWSAASFEDISIQGNAIKKYSALDFVGIETVNNPINIEEMTHVHIDVWSADFTSFGLKLVDFGPGGTTEHQVDFNGLEKGTWVGLDIPLSDFAGLTSRKNISQFILVGRPIAATTIYIDNLYFYKASQSGGGGETGNTIFEESFNQAASISSWEKIADANSSEATIEWLSTAGVEGGAMQVTGRNPSTAAGKAYIFQTPKSGLNFGGATKVKLTFDMKLNGPLVAAAVHLQTIFPGIGATNTFDLQAQGLSESSWKSFSFEFDNVESGADNFIMHFNIASGAVQGAGGVILIDNIRLAGIE